MSLKYFARYRFNGSDVAEEDYGLRDLAVESGALDTIDDSFYGSCLALDGATSLLSTGSFTNVADNVDRCFSFWAKVTSTNASPVLCYGELSSPNAFVLYARNSGGHPEFYDYSAREAPSETPVSINTWTFLTFSCNSEVLKIFADGVLSYTTTLTLTTGTTDPLRIGTDGQGEYFEGYLLDVRMWETSIEDSIVHSMFSKGPNFEEQLGTSYAQSLSRSAIIAGNILCRTMYGVQEAGGDITQSFFCVDENSQVQEAARVEHTKDTSGVATERMRVRHKENLDKTVEISPETTTFSSMVDAVTSSVVFSAEGVHLLAGEEEKGSIFFGAGRDFRIRVGDGSFLVEAYSSANEAYEKKMEISS